MRAYPVLAAGLFFLAVVAPEPSAAQIPAMRAVKPIPRVLYEPGAGWTVDPPYEFYGKHVGVRVSKLPPPKKMWDGFVGSMGLIGGAGWLCDYFGWCHKQK
jgi:hypothetical protein